MKKLFGSITAFALTLSHRIVIQQLRWPHNYNKVAHQSIWMDDGAAPTIDHEASAYPSFCFTEKGSLNSIALDMFHFSSPPGSPSFRKFQHVLALNPSFHVNLPQNIFQSNRESLTSMFRGYGLMEYKDDPREVNCSKITSVETVVYPRCPIGNLEFFNSSRIIIQTEQNLKKGIMQKCHESPNCIIIEFSDYNYRQIQQHGWGDSTILLPTMHQQPSRLVVQGQNASLLVPFANRSTDACFFGLFTHRRKRLPELKQKYLEEHPNRTIILKKLGAMKIQAMSNSYADSKVCLVAHSYKTNSGGEYHRLSEFAPFGCLPVMEEFLDEVGMDRYTKCGRVTFTKFQDLFDAVEDVLHSLDDAGRIGPDDEFAHVQWWNKGIQWETLLQTVLKQ